MAPAWSFRTVLLLTLALVGVVPQLSLWAYDRSQLASVTRALALAQVNFTLAAAGERTPAPRASPRGSRITNPCRWACAAQPKSSTIR